MPHLTGRQLMLLTATAVALITTAAGIYGLVRGPDGSRAGAPTTTPSPAIVADGPTRPAVTQDDRSLPRTNDPVAYAQAVAASLFDWDTGAGSWPTDYASAVLADADPSGEETPALVDDVATYLPTPDQWLDLTTMNVTQSIEIRDAYVPDSWAAALAQAHGQLRPGTTAVTIVGRRHRTGVWDGEPAESSHPVSFTVFVACQPSFDRCHLLRLSQLNHPFK